MRIVKYLKNKKTLRMARRALKRAFSAGGIYNSYKNSGGKQIRHYPNIVDMRTNMKSETFTYVFSLPVGFDPGELRKRSYVFRQIFGTNIELKGEDKVFTLTLFNKSLPKEIKYDFTVIRNMLKVHRLPVICGQDKFGQWIHYDLAEHPHILLAGETGSGKSTQLRSILSTFMLMKTPDELHLYLADCKQAEFHMFKNAAHVKCVVSQKEHIIKMLQFVQKEMKRRGDLTETFGVNHIDKLPPEHKQPYIVVCIDEIAMLRGEKVADELMKDLGFMGRSNGIFLIASLQRPTSDCLDTTVRSQLTTKMGFHVGSAREANIIETTGADKLITKGRFIMRGINGLTELQAPYLDEKVADELLSPIMTPKFTNPYANSQPTSAPQITDEIFKDLKTVDDIFGQDDENWKDDAE
ncbi:FtsK/SpoIIIE domain-containing protein [Priestia aryabhattai]|uniref:FtsK/SpoIIIE domain-containing protein n=1 Tax=Priestia aryabhattai TaxID=412384 RepID=UPI0015C6205A|nr:FtsK/SpoIIIE domain-containing protein [Priestia aryabhattai]